MLSDISDEVEKGNIRRSKVNCLRLADYIVILGDEIIIIQKILKLLEDEMTD